MPRPAVRCTVHLPLPGSRPHLYKADGGQGALEEGAGADSHVHACCSIVLHAAARVRGGVGFGVVGGLAGDGARPEAPALGYSQARLEGQRGQAHNAKLLPIAMAHGSC